MAPKALYTLADLESETGVSRRKIRHWIHMGLVPQSYDPQYPGAWQLPRYGEEHLTRIKKLQRWMEYKTTYKDLRERIELIGDKALEIPDIYTDD